PRRRPTLHRTRCRGGPRVSGNSRGRPRLAPRFALPGLVRCRHTAGAEASRALGRSRQIQAGELSMSIQRFETGPRMSQVVVHGNTVYLAGVVANKTAGESVAKQTQEILAIIDGHLATAGTDKSKLLSTNIYITDMKNFAEMNAVWDAWVSAGNTPARA